MILSLRYFDAPLVQREAIFALQLESFLELGWSVGLSCF